MDQFGIPLYLLGVNALGFLMTRGLGDRAFGGTGFAAVLLLMLAGGSPGVLLALRRDTPQKENMMLYVTAVMAVLLQITAAMLYFIASARGLSFDVLRLFTGSPVPVALLLIINVIAFSAFGLDKRAAVRGDRRVPIVTLLLLCLAGGAVGGLAGMQVFRHKTQKNYFTIGLPLMLLWHVLLLWLAANLF